jgi:hypothetical protein
MVNKLKKKKNHAQAYSSTTKEAYSSREGRKGKY